MPLHEHHYSELKALLECPHKYLHRKDDNASVFTTRGRAIHEAMDRYVSSCRERELPNDVDLMDELIMELVETQLTGEELVYARMLLRRFADTVAVKPVPAGYEAVTEKKLRVLITRTKDGFALADVTDQGEIEIDENDPFMDAGQSVLYAGTLDDAIFNPNELRGMIRDWKSNRVRATKTELANDDQLRFYAVLLAAHAGVAHIDLIVHYLNYSKQHPPFHMTSEDVEEAAARLWHLCKRAELIDQTPYKALSRDDKEPRPGEGCAYCNSVHSCPAVGVAMQVFRGEGPTANVPGVEVLPALKKLVSDMEKGAKTLAKQGPIPLPDGSYYGYKEQVVRTLRDDHIRILRERWKLNQDDLDKIAEIGPGISATSIEKFLKKFTELKVTEVMDSIRDEGSRNVFTILKSIPEETA